MFDIGAAELLLVAIVALVVIGPKDLPGALRGVGRVMGQLRSFTGQFRFSLDSMIREAEIEGREKEWAQKNADIMAEHPPSEVDTGSDSPRDGQDPNVDPDPAGSKAMPETDRPDGELKPLKPIATDDAGAISSMDDSPAPQSPPSEPAPSTEDSSSQTDLFGDKA